MSGTISAWRIYQPRFSASAFTGEGARRAGGRFNSKGVPVVYTAGAVSLAALELLVHLDAAEVLRLYELCEVRIDPKLIKNLDSTMLPPDWSASPVPHSVRRLGDAWIAAGSSVVLRVPSVVVEGEYNYRLNPNHRDFRKLDIQSPRPFSYDPRLVKVGS